MGQDESGCGEREVVVHQQVDVDGTVVIFAILRLPLASQLALNLLSGIEAFHGRKRRQHQAGCIQEGMLALEPPRLGLDERRNTLHRADTLLDKRDSTVQILSSITQITS